ncbi:MAG TPA: polymer-forming cytoskeletal protein [Gemmatimonadaceae bacterium]|nr:polymer-forming cytoskeletal protein [Gemmatimonadaceae bacterium]
MAIFSKDSNGTGEMRVSTTSGEGALSIIAAGMTITGDIDTDGVIKIEGRVEGAIRAARQVLVGRQGEVQGDITTREAIIGGKVHGIIVASERLEVQETSMITGDISTRAIAVVEGGMINGHVRITDAAQTATTHDYAPEPQTVEMA